MNQQLAGVQGHKVALALARWLMAAVLLTGVIAMHMLSMPTAAGGHGSIITGTAALMPAAHENTDATDSGPAVAAPTVMPSMPAGHGPSMASCILFLAVSLGSIVLAVLAALRRRREPPTRGGKEAVASGVPRGPPPHGPPRIHLCVLRV